MLPYGVICAFLFVGVSNEVKIKIIDEPFSFHGSSHSQQAAAPKNVIITTRVAPQQFSGPPHLHVLKGRCFHFTKESYKYELCPFQNVTQSEVTYRWNAFHGVLGVWKEWTIVNNSFQAMHMTRGDICVGALDREIKVFPQCGDNEKIASVTELVTCKYEMIFKTPLVCPVDALAVYPLLSPQGQQEFQQIEEELYLEESTLQGYNKERRKLFIKERIWIDPDKLFAEKTKDDDKKASANIEIAGKPDSKTNLLDSPEKDIGKMQCLEEYVKLLGEVKKLRALLNQTTSSSKKTNSIESTSGPIAANSSHLGETEIDEQMTLKNNISMEQKDSNLKQSVISNTRKNETNKVVPETDRLILDEGERSGNATNETSKKQRKGKKGDEGLLVDLTNSTIQKDLNLWVKKYSENIRERMKLHAWKRTADNL